MNTYNKQVIVIILLVLSTLSIPVMSLAEDSEARAIMEKVDLRDTGDDMTCNMQMTLVDRNGNQRQRIISVFRKDKGDDTQQLMIFSFPPEVKDSGFLSYDHDAREIDDEIWLYLPALHKTKRIAQGNKSDSFMGSDLNYSDMIPWDLEDYDFFMKEDTEVRGFSAWTIEAIPRSKEVISETGYKKCQFIVRKDNYFIVRSVQWEDRGNYVKYFDYVELAEIDGVWVGTKLHILRKKGKAVRHETVVILNDVKFNQKLDSKIFTIRRMENGL